MGLACNMSNIKTNYISLSNCLFQNFEKSHTTFFVFSKIDGMLEKVALK